MVQFRTIGGQAVHPVGLGCMSLGAVYGGQPDEAESEALLLRALDLGYTHFDTARIYGDGLSEDRIGRILKHRRSEIFLASKCGIVGSGTARLIDCRPETIRAALEESLRLLQTDHVDLYYMHRRDRDTPIEESVGAMADLIREGKMLGIGLSEMSADTLRRAAAVHPIAAIQNEYSPWVRNVELGVLDACRELGTAMVAFSPVGRGALANGVVDPAALAEGDMRRAFPRFSAENWSHNRPLIARFNTLAADAGVTPAQLALGWVLAKDPLVHVIPGTKSLAHLEENIARADWQPDDATMAAVDELMAEGKVAGHRYPPLLLQTIDTEEHAAAAT